MAKSGLAKGANSGHITEVIERKPKPSNRKGVSLIVQFGIVESDGINRIVEQSTTRRHVTYNHCNPCMEMPVLV